MAQKKKANPTTVVADDGTETETYNGWTVSFISDAEGWSATKGDTTIKVGDPSDCPAD